MAKKLFLIVSLCAPLVFSSSYLQQGNKAFKQAKYTEALTLYSQALKSGDNQALAYFNLGNTLYQLDQVGRAMIMFEKAIAEAPKFVRAYINLAGIYFELGEIGQALTYYHKAYKINPNNVSTVQMLGESYLKAGDYARALEFFEKGKSISPENDNWYFAMIDVFHMIGDKEAVITTIKTALHQKPDHVGFHLFLAETQESSGYIKEAAGSYQQVLNLDPVNEQAYFRLANLYEREENKYLAISTLKQAQAKKVSEKECVMEIARIYLSIGEINHSLEYYRIAAQNGEDEARKGLLNIGQYLLAQGSIEKAANLVMQVIKLFPGDIEASEVLKEIQSS